jgi:2-amino-4-hydroxy-6-hydroxymethyldihydropteridine diphosphokinase
MRDALVLLEEHGVSAVAKSSLYETEPFCAEWQRDDAACAQQNFLNAVIEVETSLSVDELLSVCMDVEQKLGRVRRERWGARTMDIDVLMYGDVITGWHDGVAGDTLRELVVPHPLMHKRNFVLVPFAEVGRQVVHPVLKKSIVELLRTSDDAHGVFVSEERW